MSRGKIKYANKPSGDWGYYSPLDGMLVHRRVTPGIKFAGTHLHAWVARGTVRVKGLAQDHNTMSPARARTQTAQSGVGRTNHEVTAPPIRHVTRMETNNLSNYLPPMCCFCIASFKVPRANSASHL